MGTSPWVNSPNLASGSGRDELLPILQGGWTHDLLPIPLADGMGRTSVGNNCLPKSGNNSEVPRMWSSGARSFLGTLF
jgi:hypothetical protein